MQVNMSKIIIYLRIEIYVYAKYMFMPFCQQRYTIKSLNRGTLVMCILSLSRGTLVVFTVNGLNQQSNMV